MDPINKFSESGVSSVELFLTYFLHYLSGFRVRCWETVPGLELGIALIEMIHPECLS